MLSAPTRKAPTMVSSSSLSLLSSYQRRHGTQFFSKGLRSSASLSSSLSGTTTATTTTAGVNAPPQQRINTFKLTSSRASNYQYKNYTNFLQYQSISHQGVSTNTLPPLNNATQHRPYGSLSAKVAEIAAAATASFTETEDNNDNKPNMKSIKEDEKRECDEALQELLESTELFNAQLDSLINGQSKRTARTAESLLRLVVDSHLDQLSKARSDNGVVIENDNVGYEKMAAISMDVLPPLPAQMEEKMANYNKREKQHQNEVGTSKGAFTYFNPSIDTTKRRRRKSEDDVTTNVNVKPTADLFLKCIEAWRNSGSKLAPERAEDLLIALCDLYTITNDSSLRPTTDIFNAVMDCWPNSSRGIEAAIRCEQVLRYMNILALDNDGGIIQVKPTTDSFGIVLDAWAKASYLVRGKDGYECAKRAEEILEWMELLRQSSLTNENNDYYSNVRPNTQCFASVINAWAYRCTPGSAVRAMRIFDLMVDLHAAGDEAVRPTTRAYYAVLSAWARSGGRNSADKAEDILRHMDALASADDNDDESLAVRPNVHCFNAVMMAHAHSRGGSESAQRAEELLDWMEKLYHNGDEEARPNTRSYRLAMSAWAWSRSSDAPSRTEAILQRMIAASREGNHDVIPCTRDFNTVISCCAYVQQPDMPMETKTEEEILSVTERGEGDPLRVAFSTLDALGESPHCSANSTTFSTLIKACATHLPHGAERNLWVQELFQTCSDLGLVDQRVLSQLRRAVPKDHYISLREEHENFRLSSNNTSEDRMEIETIQEEENIEEEAEIEEEFEVTEGDIEYNKLY